MPAWKLLMHRSIIWGVLLTLSACQRNSPVPKEDPSTAILLFKDDFERGLDNWFIEREKGGEVAARDRALDINVPAGCTVWFRHKLRGSIAIEYEAMAIQAGGANDRVSDLNCFWMARDPRHPDDLFAEPRSGKFADYNSLTTYYAGLGGNGNTTTRFRRYIGDAVERPLLPEHDLREPQFMLVPNRQQKIHLIADGNHIELQRDGLSLFKLEDPKPYVEGWFGFRTTQSHLQIRGFRVYRTTGVPSRGA
jgi:hypothetical protein